ncbi:MAG: YlbF family regulator [Verrucomicrobia bacterium]|nr:YlbF family regulator [Verrucomicrobiota bacterium]
MQTLTENNLVLQKTQELCQAILDQTTFRDIRLRIDTFLSDDAAKSAYQSLSEQGEQLQFKQQRGESLTPEEIAEFEKQRETFLSNPVARDFLDAQHEMHQVQESVGRYVSKTFELGRLPNPEDLHSGSCGSGCGCHH